MCADAEPDEPVMDDHVDLGARTVLAVILAIRTPLRRNVHFSSTCDPECHPPLAVGVVQV